MKKIFSLILFILLSSIGYSQCDSLEANIIVKLYNSNLEAVNFQLCYMDSSDYLIVSQDYTKEDLAEPKDMSDKNIGNYLLTADRVVVFVTDNSKFRIKLDNEQLIGNFPNDLITVKCYYKITRNKVRYLLLGSVETILIVKDDEIQEFQLTKSESSQLYQMCYMYSKWKNWKL
jgi:hypothetical protein